MPLFEKLRCKIAMLKWKVGNWAFLCAQMSLFLSRKLKMYVSKVLTILICSLLISVSGLSSEGDTYNFSWLDPDKEVFVLQNRKFRKKLRPYISGGWGFTTSGPFVDSTNLQARIGFFFFEEWGLEAIYSKNSGEENDTALSVRNPGRQGSIPFRRIVEDYMGVMALWSPFYSKINTFNSILYLDWIVGLGVGKITETNNRGEFNSGGTSSIKNETNTHTSLMWQLAMKFYVTQNIDARVNLTTVHYKAEKAKINTSDEAYYSNYDLNFSIGYSF